MPGCLPGRAAWPGARRRRRRQRARPSELVALLGIGLLGGLAVAWQGLDGRPVLLSPVASASAGTVAAPEGAEVAGIPVGKCTELQAELLENAKPQISRWEKAAAQGQTIGDFGRQASRFLNRTLATFDQNARKQTQGKASCKPEREALEKALQQQLHSIFLVQRSTIEEALHQRLKKELLKRMRRKKGELSVTDKQKLLHASMREYDSQVRDLLPFFVQNSERDRAEQRLSDLQYGIGDTPEAKDMLQKWRTEKMRRMKTRQSNGISVSLSPGLRVMLRPGGFGNLQIHSQRQVGPPHNPNEVSVSVLNDGNVIDVYNKKPNPPLIKFQPTIGIDISAG